MTKAKRFGVVYNDEGGTLFDGITGDPISHTWSVVDRLTLDREGYPREVSNHDTRAQARAACARENAEVKRVPV